MLVTIFPWRLWVFCYNQHIRYLLRDLLIIEIFTFFPDFNRVSAVGLFTKEAGLPVSIVASKKEIFTLMVACNDLIFPEFVLVTSNLLTDLVGFDLSSC